MNASFFSYTVYTHALCFVKQLQEFEKAINKRDNLIEELTWSLQQALAARDNLVSQLNSMNAVQMPDQDNAGSSNQMNIQEKVSVIARREGGRLKTLFF